MTLSIIIPVFNSRPFLSNCVSQLLEQLSVTAEILLVDDGSADGSSDLCDQLQLRYPQVRSFHQPNHGVSSARNLGLREAQGDYILFLDADDTLNSSLLHELLSDMQRHPDLDIGVFGIVFEYYRNNHLYKSERLCYPQKIRFDQAQLHNKIQALFDSNYLSSACNKLFRRTFLKENGLFFDEEMFLLEDLHFSLRCLSRCSAILCSDQAIYHYRQAEDEGNAGRRLKRIERISALIEKIEEAFGSLGDSLGRNRGEYDNLLAGIFLMLARQKIRVSRRKEIGVICDDFIAWLAKHRVSPEQLSGTYTNKVLQRKADWLFWRSRYSAVRHTVANRVKYLRYLKKRRSAHG